LGWDENAKEEIAAFKTKGLPKRKLRKFFHSQLLEVCPKGQRSLRLNSVFLGQNYEKKMSSAA
jgi:hypothetical protein